VFDIARPFSVIDRLLFQFSFASILHVLPHFDRPTASASQNASRITVLVTLC